MSNLSKLKLVLNINKTKYIIFITTSCEPISTSKVLHIKKVPAYKYLGLWLDEKLTFDAHIDNLVKKIKPRVRFLFQQKSLSFGLKKQIIQSMLLLVWIMVVLSICMHPYIY